MGLQTRQIAVTDRSAAALLDMPRAEFNRLVEAGSLPPPATIAGRLKRWRVSELEAILDGTAIDDDFEV